MSMKAHFSYSLWIILVAGLTCKDLLAQTDEALPAGNPAFSSFNYRLPVRVPTAARPMITTTESALVQALYGELHRLARYPKTQTPVTITRLPHAELEAMVCKKPCGVLGFYREGQIFLDDKLHPETNMYDRSVLLHELMHFVQDMNAAYGTTADCDRWYQREMEAYSAQQQFLSMAGSPIHVMFAGVRSLCRDDNMRQANLDKH
jgi:hypothetical protein